jgi:hypothetical protein
LEVQRADLEELATVLEPIWREPGLLARLPFTKRSIPDWLRARNLEGDLAVSHLSLNKTDLGPLNSRFVWQGANLQISSLDLRLPDGSLQGSGAIDLAARAPAAHFKGGLTGYHWGGGTVNAEGELEGSLAGVDSLRSLHAAGNCWGTDVSLSLNEDFEKVSGAFELSFDGGWPKLHLSKLRALQRDEDWSGEALSNSDGQLIFDLGNGDRQLHIVSIMAPMPSPETSPVARSSSGNDAHARE